jgi:type II secretory pathway component PulF
VEGGDSVNVAMRKLPDFFDEKEISIVESGEQTGMIQESFLAIANDLRGQEELKNKITSAMTYPVIIMLFLILAISIVMIYVIPQLMPIIGSMTSDLPFTTRALIGTSNFLQSNFVYIFIALAGITLIIVGFSRTEYGAHIIDKEKITLPITGPVYKNYLIVRTMSTFHLLSNA